MKRRRIFLLGGAAMLAMAALSSDTIRFHVKCDTLAMSSRLERNLNFRVAHARMYRFNEALVAYLRNAGFTYQTGADPDYRSPRDSHGLETVFLNIKTIGCTYRTIVWSENVIREDNFLVSVHSTLFGTKGTAAGIATDLEHVLSNALSEHPTPHSAPR